MFMHAYACTVLKCMLGLQMRAYAFVHAYASTIQKRMKMHAFVKHACILKLCTHMHALENELCIHMHAIRNCACICTH
jgi:hypothetical protein